ncbi:valine--tRNA ligase [Candidatus Woesearchaeota archaeon]|nr:valine--tRNA ligase [Candidatus Woesearchaeota archaeon]
MALEKKPNFKEIESKSNKSKRFASSRLSPKPNFKEIESRWQKWWLDKKIFKFDPKSKKSIFANDTPPPTISGRLHIGHALNYTLFDFVARYKRLAGFNVFYPIGWDDNGQPTERYVEKKLGIKSKDMPRSKFNKIVINELKDAEKLVKEDSVAFGMSYDWSTLYKTISPQSIKAAQTSFLDLHKKDLVYRAEEPMLWCPHCQTVLSQADVEDKQRATKLNYIKFKANKKDILIATTRPELLPACVAIFVHPDDKRYKKLIGKKATVPLFDYQIPIKASKDIDLEFGTGILMVCTFGDKADIEKWKKHKLPLKIIVTKEGKLNKLAGKYKGLTLAEARKKILKYLTAEKLLVKQEPLQQTVGVCWRCHEAVEFLVTKQWMINLIDYKKEFIKQGRKIKWHPKFFRARYEDWINNLGWDWVVSRQRHFGVPIPVWYCKKCNEAVVADLKNLPVDPETDKPKKKCKCGSKDFEPEHDVFDTWMTSSLTPEIALSWPDKKLSSKFFPMDLRSSGHDIIRTWAFYTIVKAFYHFKKIPWKHAMINGMVLDPKGRPMHKSLGNVVSPRNMIEKYSSDAMRYWASNVSLGEDIPFQEKELARGMKILIKLWNVSRFVELHLKTKPKKSKLKTIDQWILGRLHQTLEQYQKYFDNYQPSKARKEIEMFFLHEFADFYLEMVKHRLYGDEKANEVKYTLYQCLLGILKMWAPFIPHITEEIYQQTFKSAEKDKSIHISAFPKKTKIDKKAVKLGKLTVEAVAAIRKYKADNNMSLGKEIEKLTLYHPKVSELKKVADDIKGTMRIKELHLKKGKLKVK